MDKESVYQEQIEACYRDFPIPCFQLNVDEYGMVNQMHGNMMFRTLKRKLLNIVEGCAMPEKQEQAIKRLIVDELHLFHESFDKALQNYTKMPSPIPTQQAE